MIGVVLCGGKSTRMGSDKGLLQHEALTWVEIMANKLAGLKLAVVLSVNEQQFPLYSAKFTHLPIVKDFHSLNINGPLKGILSVSLTKPHDDLIVLACDMPEMHQKVIGHLMRISSGRKEEAFAFMNISGVEPLCAIYTSEGLKKIYECYKQGQLKKHSLHYVLENLKTFYLPVPDEWKEYFKNCNSPDDLGNLKITSSL